MEIRKYVRDALGNIPDLPENTVKNIEISVYNDTITYANTSGIEASWDNFIFKHYYTIKSRQLMENLRRYPDFRQQVVREKLSKRIASVPFMDMRPASLRTSTETTHDDLSTADGIFKCSKCHQRKTTYYSRQLRSADEPMTNFITCLNCGHKWKN
jgi:DNA-directed RNA polymerase subunit M/transcription elongation factor TFIIS